MKIEKKFYTEEAALWRSLEREADGLGMGMSLGEAEEDQLRLEREAWQIEEKAENEKKQNYQVIRQEKLDRFQVLTKMALEFAELAPMDITVNTENFFGRIDLSADCLMILPSSPDEMRTGLLTLFREAESISILRKDNDQIIVSLIYPFCTEIPRSAE
ncbi:MAG: hypothetical protein LUH20_09970 [Lachnospiraceae bacterium]|nr:hypothetical protein [Lachnospiraceae bacterium]